MNENMDFNSSMIGREVEFQNEGSGRMNRKARA
jgi:hypothetical protein